MAMGYGGQFIFIVPEKNTVIVAIAKWNKIAGNPGQQWNTIIQEIGGKLIQNIN